MGSGHNPHKKSIHLETHGDEAITLIQNTSSTFGKCIDITRLSFGSLLLFLSIFSITYAITEHRTLFPTSFPNWTLYIILIIALFIVGVLEGLQIAVVELAHEDPQQYEKYYPRAAKLLKYENTGRNVERFLIGRQLSLVLLVFVCARITTFDVFIFDIPDWAINSFMFSGFLGVILVVTVAQLTPQVLASAYPVEFLNLYGMNVAFSMCLIVESTGIAHAVWLLCYTVKHSIYSCVCKYHTLNKQRLAAMKLKKEKQIDDMANIAQNIEMRVEMEQSIKKKSMAKDVEFVDKDFTMNNSKVVLEIKQMMQQIDDRPDLFYLHGDNKYPGPSFYGDKFRQAGLKMPCFLLPPNDEKHIPPHIVAMALLKKAVADMK